MVWPGRLARKVNRVGGREGERMVGDSLAGCKVGDEDELQVVREVAATGGDQK